MSNTIETLNALLATGGLALIGSSVFLAFDLFHERKLATLVMRYGMHVILLTTFAGVSMTLYYSDVLGFVPCGLCWFQRIFLYPQVVIAAAAISVRDRVFAPIYCIVLSTLGILVALYQHYLQMGGAEVVTCPAAGADADCSARLMFEYGFITFPLLAAIVFTFVIVVAYYYQRMQKAAV